ncbi:hypothetical protein D9613_007097 [Agrocybe pediades]|uniref:Protein bir1 n=1 Tax=Agrocybe pediades TaxID=84607 RepID=A0A8H4VHL7_9AGAR|nr:hypothetical protein D9613_007097 [Agrocybe pediades]
MEALDARINSFKKSKRVKNPAKPSSSTSVKWPHPLTFRANPETLADAGFYYDPSYDDPDNVTCFVCDKELAGWEEEDDPFLIHYSKCSQNCCWASAYCGIASDTDRRRRFISTDKSRIPSGKQMEKARHETFLVGKGWIHDKTPNHGANSKMMARAGFVYTPQEAGDDLATCLYCDTALRGWVSEDDPMEEHRKRESKTGVACTFFTASPHLDSSSQSKPPSKAQTTKPPSRASTKPPSKSTSRSKHQDVIQPTKTHDGPVEEDESEIESTGKTAYAKTPHKGRATSSTARKSSAKTPKPKSKTRSSSRTGLKNVVEEDEEEEEEEEAIPPPPPTTVKKSRSKSVAKPEVVSQTEPEEEDVEPRKPSRSRTKKVASEPEEDLPRKSSRSKAKQSSVAPSIDEEVTRKPSRSKSKAKAAAESEQEEPITAKPKHKRIASRSKSKAPAPVPASEVEESEVEPEVLTVVKKTSSKKSKAPTLVPAAQHLFDDDVFTDHYVPPPPPSPPPAAADSNTMEMPPLSVPKRNTKKVATSETEDVPTVQKEKKKPSKPKKAQPPEPVSDDEVMDNVSAIKSHDKKAVSSENEHVELPEKEAKKPSKAQKQHQPPPILMSDDEIMERDRPISSTNSRTTSKPLPSKASLQSSSKRKLSENLKPPSVKSQQKLKVVEISSDEEVEEETAPPPPKREQATPDIPPPAAPSKKISTGSVKAPPAPAAQPTPVHLDLSEIPPKTSSKKREKKVAAAVSEAVPEPPKPAPVEATPAPPSPVPVHAPAAAPPRPASPVIDNTGDVSMEYHELPAETGPEPAHQAQARTDADVDAFEPEHDQDVKMLETPVTPPRQTAQARLSSLGARGNLVAGVQSDSSSSQPKSEPEPVVKQDVVERDTSPPAPDATAAAAASEPPYVPALSKLPFIPLTSLSEAELDMTVEEWIRYQMEVEYDKFRRDGERELQRFKKRAEEVRKMIEGL